MMWNLTVVGMKEKTAATTDASYGSFLLGSNVWTIVDDSKSCYKGKPYSALLKLTGCKEGQFTCQDGQCIEMEERCDQIVQCRDNSDESSCSKADPSFSAGSDVRTLIRGIGPRMLAEAWHSLTMSAKP